MKQDLLELTIEEMKQFAAALGEKPYRGKQVFGWIYRGAASFGEMTDLPKAFREKLQANAEIGNLRLLRVQEDRTDGTRKFLFSFGKDAVESVFMKYSYGNTLCVSTQVGCKMGCRFCMTGRQGFHGNLTAADILSQFFSVDDAASLTNAVFMGMGEPLDNWEEVKRVIEVLTSPWGLGWSPKRITLSTIGVLPVLKRFLDESRCHLAVSLHNPFGEERFSMMKVEKAWPLRDVVELIRKYDFSGQRRVSFEYTLFEGWNDSPRHADALVRLLKGLECRVNLIRFHRIPDFPYGSVPENGMEAFRDRLTRGGLTATIRASRGEDIFAACGLLAGKHKSK